MARALYAIRMDDRIDSSKPNVIKDVRRRMGITQAALAARLHVHQTTIMRWERRQRRPHPAIEQAALELLVEAGR